MCFNRLMNFHVVRSTRPCSYTALYFIGKTEFRTPRDPGHQSRVPDYPDPQYYLSYTQKYFFRAEALRHLRVEQYTRPWAVGGNSNGVFISGASRSWGVLWLFREGAGMETHRSHP